MNGAAAPSAPNRCGKRGQQVRRWLERRGRRAVRPRIRSLFFVRSKESLTIEVDEVVGGIGDPDLRFPGALGQVLAHRGPVEEPVKRYALRASFLHPFLRQRHTPAVHSPPRPPRDAQAVPKPYNVGVRHPGGYQPPQIQ